MSSLRPPTLEDVPHAARLANEHSRDPVDEERLRQEWTAPNVDLEQDARVDERTYALVEDLGEGRVWIELHGDPSPAALEWTETRAHQLGGRRLFTGGWSTNTGLFEVIETRGYALTRQSATLEIQLTDDLPAPVWPAGITPRVMREGQERTFYEVHQEAFRDTWEHTEDPFDEWSHWLLHPSRFDPGLWFLASADGDACGIAICEPRRTLPDLGCGSWQCAAHGAAAESVARCSCIRCASVGSRVLGSASTPPALPAHIRSTRAWACGQRTGSTSTRGRSRERLARPLSEVPDLHRGGCRRRL